MKYGITVTAFAIHVNIQIAIYASTTYITTAIGATLLPKADSNYIDLTHKYSRVTRPRQWSIMYHALSAYFDRSVLCCLDSTQIFYMAINFLSFFCMFVYL